MIDSAGLISIEKPCTAVVPTVSTTFAEKENEPAAVGVPLRDPPPLRLTPVGKFPAATVHVRVPEPPDAARLAV